jgi:hypothetical protein
MLPPGAILARTIGRAAEKETPRERAGILPGIAVDDAGGSAYIDA